MIGEPKRPGLDGGNDSDDATDNDSRRGELWPIIIIGALLFVILVLMARPCEFERLQVIAASPEFGPSNTVCSPVLQTGCHCSTTEGELYSTPERPHPAKPAKGEVTPMVTF